MNPQITIVVSTYNRVTTLARTIQGILQQGQSVSYELIIVDNNCSDDTAEVVHSFAEQNANVRYIFEQQQGLSYGRNAGIAAARSDLIAFTDDDVVPDHDWVQRIYSVSEAHPDCGCFGGKVLPLWPAPPPGWLTEAHWGPLALVDYGTPQSISAANPKCLIGANMILRRRVFEQVGYFSPVFQRVKGGVGTTEDQELQGRYWKIGGLGWFDPSIVVHAEVQPERLQKKYHRRWHFAHGQMNALMRDPSMERSRRPIFGVPGHVYRQLLGESGAMLSNLARGRHKEAFQHEVHARFCLGFLTGRLRQSA